MKKTMFKVALWGANARMSRIARVGRVALLGAMMATATLAACSEAEEATEDAVGVDGSTYRTKVYDGVEWMIENSRRTTGVTGCDYDPIDRTNVDGVNYGRMYSWSCAASACPDGWSLPTDADFTALEAALNAGGDAAWADWNSGSSLAGGGYHTSFDGFQGSAGYWWSSSSSGRNWYVKSGNTSGNFYSVLNSYLFSVRCRKN